MLPNPRRYEKSFGPRLAAHAARVQRHLASIGLPTSPAWIDGRSWSSDRLVEHMSRDKKVKDGRIGFASAMAWIMFLITLLITLAMILTRRRWVHTTGEDLI